MNANHIFSFGGVCCVAVLLDDLGVTQMADILSNVGEVHGQDLGQKEPTRGDQAGGER